ncbi:ABC transporter ATP-binding protein [Candidatus Thioglobus sp.]|nr:ABC transporter ATP-binding protein [Candidatus Thioglobus sp.]MDC0407799.1 ABC transporter ATP-binding protein [Candidatus Thioglobus sp.]MDC1104947.1 ABC transporter ATP-binding protein [Candidatus Thioglobus sp.]
MAEIKLESIYKNYDEVGVIKGVDIEIHDGEFVVFVGPSGSGKSTLLRMIAGLEDISSGLLMIDGEEMNDVPPSKRELAMVFQSYALYPHMTVLDNLAFGLKISKVEKNEIKDRVNRVAEVLQIHDLLDRLPKQLSGGQRQRVAIGRAIIREPKVFLFDEPLSNLDSALRSDMRVELSELHEKLNATMIYVTHDQIEAMTLADKIVVLNNGLVEQIDTPTELYNHPKTEFVAGFIGSPTMNFLRGDIVNQSGAELYGVRPEHITLSPTKGKIKCTLKHLENLGADTLYYMQSEDDQKITVRVEGMGSHKKGEVMFLDFDEANVHMFKDGKRV